jgi:hypothetical protein
MKVIIRQTTLRIHVYISAHSSCPEFSGMLTVRLIPRNILFADIHDLGLVMSIVTVHFGGLYQHLSSVFMLGKNVFATSLGFWLLRHVARSRVQKSIGR